VLEAALVRHGWHRLLSQQQALQGDWQLDLPLLPPQGPALEADASIEAARAIGAFVEAQAGLGGVD
jgi:hypothetical protein